MDQNSMKKEYDIKSDTESAAKAKADFQAKMRAILQGKPAEGVTAAKWVNAKTGEVTYK